jgi:LCP family protein required for cell wall assembly
LTHEQGDTPAPRQPPSGILSRLRSPLRRRRYGPRPKRSTRYRVFRGVAIVAAVALAGGTLAAYIGFRAEWDGIKRINVLPDLQRKPRPPVDPHAMNILVIGSDSRAGANKHFGARVVGQRSDTVMVLHISPGGHQVVVLSFPRDSVVPILACSPEDGSPGQAAQPSGYVEQINATFAYGGPGCLWETIEQTTGIHINDFIELTFTGFEHVIDDIGGVNVCLPVAVHDSDSLLNLSAGKHHIDGPQALAFWRARYIGEGSDLQRIQRDQYLMASLLQGIERSGFGHSPTKILKVIEDLAGHGYIATDTELTPGRLFTVANELRNLPPGAVQFIEIPVIPYPGNPLAWVQWSQPQATTLFAAIAHDTKLPAKSRSRAAAQTASGALSSPSPSRSLSTVSPAQVNVVVLNGAARAGLAASTASSLMSRGFHVVGIADASTSDYTNSIVEYASSADLPAAQTLAALISNVTVEQDTSLSAGTVQLIVGSTFTALRSAPAATGNGSSSGGSQDLAGEYGGITGNVQICSDSSAFAGPDGTN